MTKLTPNNGYFSIFAFKQYFLTPIRLSNHLAEHQKRKSNHTNMLKKTIQTFIEIYQYDELPVEYKQLVDEAKQQVYNAYAIYSGFHVGAAVLLENGEIFAGSNQENSAYPSGLCAERVAMFYANASRPNTAVNAIAIAAYTNGNFLSSPITPCGACRQVLLESEMRFEKDMTIILYGTSEIVVVKNSRQLLPLCFEKSSLRQ